MTGMTGPAREPNITSLRAMGFKISGWPLAPVQGRFKDRR